MIETLNSVSKLLYFAAIVNTHITGFKIQVNVRKWQGDQLLFP
jgi:hypothetical protein